jgi:hypothetical protein
MSISLRKPSALPPQFSIAPGFSRVSRSQCQENRFNGFPPAAQGAVETANLATRSNTRLKLGANERAALRGCCFLKSLTFATIAIALLCALPVFAQIEPEPKPAKRAAPAAFPTLPVPPAELFTVKRVNEEKFLNLLAQQDKPVALVKLPNGERRLLMVMHQADATASVD